MSDTSTVTYTSRRAFLKALGAAGAITLTGVASATSAPLTAWAMQGDSDTVLVTLFLRGGADGLGIVVPHGDDMLYNHRPLLGQPLAELGDLDGFFGLDANFSPLLPEFAEGRLAFVHAVGPPTMNRSHFAAQPILDQAGGNDGWLQRALAAGSFAQVSAGLTIGWQVSPPLAGPWGGSVVLSVDNFAETAMSLSDALPAYEEMYGATPYQLEKEAVSGSLASLAQFAEVMSPSDGYPGTPTAGKLREAAALIKADVGVRGVAIDVGGWDSHANQRQDMEILGADLSGALAAFQADLGSHASRVVTVAMSEFGRTAQENAGGGTDHGRGSLMMVLGERLADHGGGRVHLRGAWPGLGLEDLDTPDVNGGLKVTTDFRDVLSELVSEHLDVADVSSVFPGHVAAPVGLVSEVEELGDVDQSGTIDSDDVTAILRDAAGDTPVLYDPVAGDLDGDGDTDLRDALLLAQQLEG